MRPFCKHTRTRCLHGDEVVHRMSLLGAVRRSVCLDCGKALRPLPPVCSVTGAAHDPRLTP